jgi:hypothetical protein
VSFDRARAVSGSNRKIAVSAITYLLGVMAFLLLTPRPPETC